MLALICYVKWEDRWSAESTAEGLGFEALIVERGQQRDDWRTDETAALFGVL